MARSPARRRGCVEHVVAKLGVPERTARRVLGQHRSTQRKVARTADDEAALTGGPSSSWPDATAVTATAGSRRCCAGPVAGQPQAGRADLATRGAESAGQAAEAGPALAGGWLLCPAAAGAPESGLGVRLRRGSDPRGVPEHIRSDQGPEFIATAVKDWIAAVGAKTAYIGKSSPWENGYVESFNGKLRDELLNSEMFNSLREAQIMIESWRRHYNTIRPHSELSYHPPAPEVTMRAPTAWPAAQPRPTPPATLPLVPQPTLNY